LSVPEVFYFGNAIGEVGNSATVTNVDALDNLQTRNNTRNLLNPAPIDFKYDFIETRRLMLRMTSFLGQTPQAY
jgi:hypothetical protein